MMYLYIHCTCNLDIHVDVHCSIATMNLFSLLRLALWKYTLIDHKNTFECTNNYSFIGIENMHACTKAFGKHNIPLLHYLVQVMSN